MDDYVHARTRVQHDDISAIFQEVETAYLPAALEKSRTGTAFLSFFFFLYRGWEKFDCRLFGEEVWTVSMNQFNHYFELDFGLGIAQFHFGLWINKRIEQK